MAYGAAGTPITGSPPACRVFNSAAISLANNTQVDLTFDSERFDTDNMHSTVSNTGRITINTAGLYQFTGHVAFAANATGFRWASVYLNGGPSFLGFQNVLSPTAADQTIITVTALWKCVVGDFVTLRVTQTSGGALNVNAAAAYSPEFEAVWVGLGT